MPEIANPLENVGYLIAAGTLTLVTLVGYTITLIRGVHEARQRRAELYRRSIAAGSAAAGESAEAPTR